MNKMKVKNEVYYFKIIPKKIHINKSIVFDIHQGFDRFNWMILRN